MRSRLARRLIIIASRWIQASYNAYVKRTEEGFPDWWDKPWAYGAKRVNRICVPLALKLNQEAAVIQMIEESWWG